MFFKSHSSCNTIRDHYVSFKAGMALSVFWLRLAEEEAPKMGKIFMAPFSQGLKHYGSGLSLHQGHSCE